MAGRRANGEWSSTAAPTLSPTLDDRLDSNLGEAPPGLPCRACGGFDVGQSCLRISQDYRDGMIEEGDPEIELRCRTCHAFSRYDFTPGTHEVIAPTGLDEPARSYAELVSEARDPGSRVVHSIDAIRWREPLTGEDREQIEAARAASRIEPPTAELAGDHILVRMWVVSKQRLICRILTVRATGDVLREDAVIAENLPIA